LSKQYYIRIRGTVRGPFAPEKLKELARRGQFSRVHHVSIDGVNWEPAASHPELLPEAIAVKIRKRPVPSEAEDGSYELEATDEPAVAGSGRNEPAGEADRQDRVPWYYASAGRQVGPVSFAQLKQLAAQGALQHNTPVWSEGMPQWSEAASVPGLLARTELNICCPYCGNLLKATEQALGRTVPCPVCQRPITVPSASTTPAGGQRQESAFPVVASQSSGWSREDQRRKTRIWAAVAGGVVGLLFVVAFATWAVTRPGPGDENAPEAGIAEFEPTGTGSPEAGCAACGTVMAVFVAGLIAIVVLNIALLVWVARDAKARGMDSAVVWMLLVMFTGLLGLLIYIFSRPQGNVLPCPTCGNKRLQASARCPHCGNP